MHYNGCNYLSMLGLKLNHVSKRGPRWIQFLVASNDDIWTVNVLNFFTASTMKWILIHCNTSSTSSTSDTNHIWERFVWNDSIRPPTYRCRICIYIHTHSQLWHSIGLQLRRCLWGIPPIPFVNTNCGNVLYSSIFKIVHIRFGYELSGMDG